MAQEMSIPDPADGHQIWDHVLDVKGPGVSIPMAPIAANGLVYVGNAGGDQAGVTGHVYALDAKDGHVVWKFDVVPETGLARSTWTNPKYPISGGAFWTSFTLDEKACCTCPRAIRRPTLTANGGLATTSLSIRSLRSTRRTDRCWATTNWSSGTTTTGTSTVNPCWRRRAQASGLWRRRTKTVSSRSLIALG